MAEKFGWCFIGAGNIAERVMQDFTWAKGAYPVSVWSRNFARAQKFAEKYGAVPCKTAEEAMDLPGVQAVYVAAYHPAHKPYTLMALERGKSVLCEKPLALNQKEAGEMIELAKKKNLYLMDGIWTRHNPVIKQALSWVKEGRIGKLRSINASFCYSFPFDPSANIYKPEMGGGALLDVGVYTIALSRFFFDSLPVNISAAAAFAPSGVDELCSMQFQYADGSIARLFCGTALWETQDAWISGTEGSITLPQFWAPRSAELHTAGGTEIFEGGFEGEGLHFEFDAAAADILAGKKENALLSHTVSLDIMGLIDAVMAKMHAEKPNRGQTFGPISACP